MVSTRKIEFDILKGILIICVVIGHAIKTPFINVFWFHVPAFFMIAGYFTKIPQHNPLTDKVQWKTWFHRYMMPYFSWSVVLYCLLRPEGILKNILRTLYGGLNNVTAYSYPFWFVNALLVATVIFTAILFFLKNLQQAHWVILMIISMLWYLIHVKAIFPLPFPLPWGMDQALGALVFMGIGFLLKKYETKRWHIVFPLLSFLYVVACQIFPTIYCTLNMMPMTYNNIVLDLTVPIIFTLALYKIALGLSYVPGVRDVFSSIGNSTFTIFFTHAAILAVWPGDFTIETVLVAVAAGWGGA